MDTLGEMLNPASALGPHWLLWSDNGSIQLLLVMKSITNPQTATNPSPRPHERPRKTAAKSRAPCSVLFVLARTPRPTKETCWAHVTLHTMCGPQRNRYQKKLSCGKSALDIIGLCGLFMWAPNVLCRGNAAVPPAAALRPTSALQTPWSSDL